MDGKARLQCRDFQKMIDELFAGSSLAGIPGVSGFADGAGDGINELKQRLGSGRRQGPRRRSSGRKFFSTGNRPEVSDVPRSGLSAAGTVFSGKTGNWGQRSRNGRNDGCSRPEHTRLQTRR